MFPKNKDSLHHAYFFTVQNREEAQAELLKHIEHVLDIPVRGNVDCVVRTYDKLSIDDARDIKEMLMSKPIDIRVCVFSVGSILMEAQNALLKLFEDPPSSTHFFIISETDAYLLPTLRSRLEIQTLISSEKQNTTKEVQTFISSKLPERMKIVDTIVDRVKDSENGNEIVRQFLSLLEKEVHTQKIKNRHVVLDRIIEAKEFLLLPSAHKKGILESIALSL